VLEVGAIYLTGEINKNAAQTVQTAFKTFKKDKVTKVILHLNSPGGDLGSGSKIILEIMNAQMKDKIAVITYVGEKELCASMCTGIFAIGAVREASPKSIWIFHSPYVKNEDDADEERQKAITETIATAREALMAMYKIADPVFALTILKPYVYGYASEKELILTGEEITELSDHYINILVD
jgi:ATP-dependent protease ClpP protease subunit